MPKARENAMAIDEVDQTVVTQEPTPTGGRETVQTDSRRTTRTGPGGAELARRIVVLVFGLIQIVIGARIILLLLDAREANALVSAILNISQVFVAPFEGMLRTDSIHAAGSVLDITAIVAFVGWTILELIVFWVIGIFGRRSAAGTA
jgi:YGGT family